MSNLASVTVYCDADERYPDYLVHDQRSTSSETAVEVPPETRERWMAAAAAYEQMQNEVAEAIDRAKAAQR